MNKEIKKKIVIYVVKNGKLLVFRHIDFSYEQVGIQVPSGSVKENEKLQEAALRELTEETGFSDFKIINYLGSANYDQSPSRNEIHERHFYQAEPTKKLPERWNSEEKHDGIKKPTRFECFWISVKSGHILESGQGEMLYKIKF